MPLEERPRESVRTPGMRAGGAAPDDNSLVERGNAALVSPERMVVRDFNHDYRNLVWVLDPQFHESPYLSPRFAEDGYTGVQQAPMLCVHISDLHPHRDPVSRRLHRPTADLEKTVAEEEHEARRVRAAELPVDGEAQRVSVEPVAACGVQRAHENSAAEYLHALILPGQRICLVNAQVKAARDDVTHIRIAAMGERIRRCDPAGRASRSAAFAAFPGGLIERADPVAGRVKPAIRVRTPSAARTLRA